MTTSFVPDGRCFLVTGSNGFLGRHLVRNLAEAGPVRLRLVARDGVVEDLPAAARTVSTFVAGDPADAMDLSGVAAVLHVPDRESATGTSGADHTGETTRSLASRAAEAGVRRFVMVSRPAIREPLLGRASSQLLAARSAEEGLLDVGARTGLEVVVVRPCLMAGEGQRGGALHTLFRLCRHGIFPVLAGLGAPRALVDVEDVARAVMLAIDHGSPGAAYPATSGVHYDLGDLLSAAGALVGNPRPYLRLPAMLLRGPFAAADWSARLLGRQPPWSDDLLTLLLGEQTVAIDASRRELGYAPHYRDLRAMLARTYAWFGMSGQL